MPDMTLQSNNITTPSIDFPGFVFRILFAREANNCGAQIEIRTNLESYAAGRVFVAFPTHFRSGVGSAIS